MDRYIPYSADVALERRPQRRIVLSLDPREMTKKSTFDLTPAQLGRLLAVSVRTADSADAMVEEETKARLLQEHLGRRLSDAPSFAETLSAGMNRPIAEIQALLDRSVKETLLDSRCDLAVLKAVKDYSKKLSAMVASGPQTLITATIYYAAVASAMLYHSQQISQYTQENLAERFLALTQRSWIDRDLLDLFARAAVTCRQIRTDPG